MNPGAHAAILAAAMAAVLIGCGQQPEGGQPASAPAGAEDGRPRPQINVLLITLDTTRADRVGCYGYAKAGTPALDGLAKGGLRYANAFTHVPLTLPSHACMLTGMRPPEHGLRDNGRGRLADDVPLLQQALSKRGYRTAAFLASFVLDKQFGLARGFDVYDDRMQSGGENVYDHENPGNVVADRALKWLGERGDGPFFCWVHFFDPHLPYAPPEPFKGRHADPYDGEIAFMDSQVRRLLDFLDAGGLREKTLIVVAGDHGESFGAHEEIGHGPLLYETTMHVPAIVSLPGRIEPGRVSEAVIGLSGVAPTVLSLVGEPRVEAMTASPWPTDAGDPQAACYGESEFLLHGYGWAPLASLTTARWRYIQCPQPELYDRQADRAERTNRIADEPQIAGQMKRRLATLIGAMKTGRAVRVDVDAEALAALRALGYLGGTASRAAAVDPAERKDPKAMMAVFNACSQAEALEAGKRYQQIVDLLEPLADRSPESAEVHDYLVAAYMGLGRNDAALPHIEAYLAIDPSDRTMVANLGSVLMDGGKRAEATRILRHGLQLPRRAAEPVTTAGASKIEIKLRTNLGILLGEQGKLAEAIEQYRLVLGLDPEHLEATNNLANALNMAGRPDEAIPFYQAALRQKPDSPAILANYGVALARLGRIPSAIAQYRRSLQLKPDAPDVQINLGDALMAAREVEPALAAYREAVRLAPTQNRPAFVLGRVLMGLGRGEEAIRAFEQAAAIEPTAPIYNNIAVLHTQAGRLDEAVAQYEKALALDPDAVNVRNNVGVVLCRQGKYAGAIGIWREGLRRAADDPLMTYDLAWWLATCPQQEIRDGKEAVRLAETLADKTDRKNPQALDALAAAYAEAGRFPDATAAAREAMVRASVLGQTELFHEIDARAKLYAAGKPYRQPPPE